MRLFGATDKSQLMQSLHAIFVPESEHVFAEELLAIAEKRSILSSEIVVRTLGGQELELLFTIAFPASDPSLRCVLVTLMDITPRKRAERAVQEEAQTLETLNRVGRTIAAELDLKRVVQAVTDAATEVSGAEFGAFFYNVTNETGESYMLYTLSGAPREAFEKFGMPRNTAVFAPTFAGLGTVRLHDVMLDPRYGKSAPHFGMPKGHLPVRSYLAVPVISRSGEVIGGLFFGHSRTAVFDERAERLVTGIASQAAVAIDSARLYEQRLQLIEQLRESDRRKDEFLATLAHELRNPLAPLRNSLHMLRIGGGRTTRRARRCVEMMERQVNHLIRLVDDLLEVSRISRGAFELRRERVELVGDRSQRDRDQRAADPSGRHTSSCVSLPEEPLWLDGDPVRLAQILANLLNNAAKYTRAGRARSSSHARREGERGDRPCATTAPASRPRRCRACSRCSAAAIARSGADQGGLGIGLALARRLAEMHGGTITAPSAGSARAVNSRWRCRSRPTQSARPAARQPIAAPARTAARSGRRRQPGRCRKPRHAARVARRRSQAWPRRLEALELFKSYDPTVVLLDIGMPEMDGYEVARRIRADFADRPATLVALTGWGQDEDRRRAKEAGFDHHLIKPADLAALEALLTSLR